MAQPFNTSSIAEIESNNTGESKDHGSHPPLQQQQQQQQLQQQQPPEPQEDPYKSYVTLHVGNVPTSSTPSVSTSSSQGTMAFSVPCTHASSTPSIIVRHLLPPMATNFSCNSIGAPFQMPANVGYKSSPFPMTVSHAYRPVSVPTSMSANAYNAAPTTFTMTNNFVGRSTSAPFPMSTHVSGQPPSTPFPMSANFAFRPPSTPIRMSTNLAGRPLSTPIRMSTNLAGQPLSTPIRMSANLAGQPPSTPFPMSANSVGRPTSTPLPLPANLVKMSTSARFKAPGSRFVKPISAPYMIPASSFVRKLVAASKSTPTPGGNQVQPQSQDQSAAGQGQRKVLANGSQSTTSLTSTANSSLNNVNTTRKEPQLLKWKRLSPTARNDSIQPPPRHGHRCVTIEDRYVLVFGGGNEGLFQDMNIFDTQKLEWFQVSTVGNPPPKLAAFGAVFDKNFGERILVFGGVEERVIFSDALYELRVEPALPNLWRWRPLNPLPSRSLERPHPCARMGHSFTIANDKVILFGGLTNIAQKYGDFEHQLPEYLNDLYVLNIRTNFPHGVWDEPETYGMPPCPRESHTAVAYSSMEGSRYNKVIIFGGMCGRRLGDVHQLDIDTMMWCRIGGTLSFSPVGRSLHTATLIGARMYIFGGWTETSKVLDNLALRKYFPEETSQCVASVGCLNVETMTWEKVKSVSVDPNGTLPPPRAGHCAFNIGSRIYIWSGRDGHKKLFGQQVCLDDFWQLDVQPPPAPLNVRLLHSYPDKLSIAWDPSPGADSYIVQCMPAPELDQFLRTNALN